MKTYRIETQTEVRYVSAATRKAAVSKLTGMSEKAAIAAGQIKTVTLCKE